MLLLLLLLWFFFNFLRIILYEYVINAFCWRVNAIVLGFSFYSLCIRISWMKVSIIITIIVIIFIITIIIFSLDQISQSDQEKIVIILELIKNIVRTDNKHLYKDNVLLHILKDKWLNQSRTFNVLKEVKLLKAAGLD